MKRQARVVPSRNSLSGRTVLDRAVVHIPDILADPEYTWAGPQKFGEYRTMLGVPLMREGTPIGVLALTREKARPFTAAQIELMSTFADQAVIAIETLRLFNEVQELRTTETGAHPPGHADRVRRKHGRRRCAGRQGHAAAIHEPPAER